MALVTEIVASINMLPALPDSVLRIISALNAGSTDAAELAELCQRDEALAAAVLRTANSAQFGRPGRTFDLQESLVRIGNQQLARIVLRHQVADTLSGPMPAYGLHRGGLWRNALGGALAAERLASLHSPRDRGGAFVGALLRDIGKLALDAHYGGEYLAKVQAELAPDRTFDEAERAAFGYDHQEVGAALALHWGLPESIVQAIGSHHEPPEEPSGSEFHIVDFVHAGDILALWAGLAEGHDGLQYRICPRVRDALALSRQTAEQIAAAILGELNTIESEMNQSACSGEAA